MSIQTGDKIPQATVYIMGEKGPQATDALTLFADKKVVFFAVPGAFTPGCSLTHLPGYVVNADKIKAQGVDSIICMSVNDAFVMDAWGKAQNAEEIVMLGDGNGEFSRALGLDMDVSGFGMGQRCKRFAMIVENGRITLLNIDESGSVKESAAEVILQTLQA